MYKLLVKHGQLMAFGLGLLISLIFLISVLGGLDDFNMLDPKEKGATSIFNVGLYSAVFLAVVGAVGILLFGVYHAVSNPKSAFKFLIGLGVIIVLFILFYSMAPAVESGKLFETMQKFDVSQGVGKFIHAALYTMLSLMGLCVLAFAGSEVRNLFK